MIIVIMMMVMIMCCISSVLAGGAWFLFFVPQEGDSCKGDDKNAEFEIDEDGECTFVTCDSGYRVDTGTRMCVLSTGDDDDSGGEDEDEDEDEGGGEDDDDDDDSGGGDGGPTTPAQTYGVARIPENSVMVAEVDCVELYTYYEGSDCSIKNDLSAGGQVNSPNNIYQIEVDSNDGKVIFRDLSKTPVTRNEILEFEKYSDDDFTLSTASLGISAYGLVEYSRDDLGTTEHGLQPYRLYLSEHANGYGQLAVYGKNTGDVREIARSDTPPT
jgi:hypothetical protein